MRLLESVARHEHGAPAKQLAREAGLALPTAYHLLRTLAHEGYLRREKGLFFLGEAAERLSRNVAARSPTRWPTGAIRSVCPCITRSTATARSRSSA
jgi:DNA-binding IclR family transcriptional regulator